MNFDPPTNAPSTPSVDLQDIEDRGYVLIKQFLNSEEIAGLEADFESAKVQLNTNYHLRRPSLAVADQLFQRCMPLAKKVSDQTGIHATTINDAVYFATFTNHRTLTSPNKGEQKFPWHQDHENYWIWQDVNNYLNFYIPVVKPCLERSNLGVLPFDRLRERNPELAAKMIGLGATRIIKRANRWVVRDDNVDRNLGALGFDPSEIQEIPQLAPGDLLLLRGDVVHCTQDASTRRIAVSVRMINGQAELCRSRLARGGAAKTLMIYNSRSLFGPAMSFYRSLHTDSVPAELLNEHMLNIRRYDELGYVGATRYGRMQFARQLAWEKTRALWH